jgi:hypothetical protein
MRSIESAILLSSPNTNETPTRPRVHHQGLCDAVPPHVFSLDQFEAVGIPHSNFVSKVVPACARAGRGRGRRCGSAPRPIEAGGLILAHRRGMCSLGQAKRCLLCTLLPSRIPESHDDTQGQEMGKGEQRRGDGRQNESIGSDFGRIALGKLRAQRSEMVSAGRLASATFHNVLVHASPCQPTLPSGPPNVHQMQPVA